MKQISFSHHLRIKLKNLTEMYLWVNLYIWAVTDVLRGLIPKGRALASY